MGLGVRELFDNNIKVHFAGSDGGEIFYAALLAAQTKYRLFSCYKYILKRRPDDDFRLPADHVIRVQDTVNRHVIQDSGLFTLMFGAGKGQTQTLESLTEWQDKLIAFVQQNDLRCTCVELDLSGGAITYAVTFLCTDIIGEIWGKATAQRVVKYGFIGQIFATACIMLTGVFPATDAVMDNAYQTLLGQNWIFVIGSLSAYLVSQSWDVAVFHAIRDRYIAKHGSTKGGRWLWNNGSTITSQIWDTVIYAVISFGFGLGWVHTHEGRMQLIGIIIGQYLLKACLALLDTPFFYFFTRNADRR